MCVAAAAQRTGIGRDLLTRFERDLLELKFASIYLETGANGPAARFYENCGYESLDLVSLRKTLRA